MFFGLGTIPHYVHLTNLYYLDRVSPVWDSNPWSSPWKGDDLNRLSNGRNKELPPLFYKFSDFSQSTKPFFNFFLAVYERIELSAHPWQGCMLATTLIDQLKSVKDSSYLRPRIPIRLNFTYITSALPLYSQVTTYTEPFTAFSFFHYSTGLEPVTSGSTPTL